MLANGYVFFVCLGCSILGVKECRWEAFMVYWSEGVKEGLIHGAEQSSTDRVRKPKERNREAVTD